MEEVKAIENKEKITYINRNIMNNLPKGLKEQLGINSFYVLEDVNKYSNQELLESNNFLEKIFLLEKSKNE